MRTQSSALLLLWLVCFFPGAGICGAPASDRTIHVALNAPVTLGAFFPEIRTNLVGASFRLEILDARQQRIREGTFDSVATRPNQLTRSRTIAYWVKESFPDTGVFFIRRIFEGKDEQQPPRKIHEDDTWKIRVDYPTVAVSAPVDSVYFWGEEGTINFAAMEYADLRLYSFSLESTTDTLRGKGPLINLSQLTEDIGYAKPPDGSYIHVKGMYNGRTFLYRNPVDSSVQRTEWWVHIRKPELNIITPWDQDDSSFVREDKVFNLNQHVNWGPTQFVFVYVGAKGDRWLHKVVELDRLTIDDPAGLLMPPPNQYTRILHKPFLIIQLNPNPEFLNAVPADRSQVVELGLTFSTQFGQILKRRYKARVY